MSMSMSVAKSRTVALAVALATLAANGVASALLSQLQLESDAYGLVGGFECYLHLVNVLSVFGFIGSLRQHPLSMAIFSTYLLLDSVVFAVPRLALVWLLPTLAAPVCASPAGTPWEGVMREWTPEGCERVVWWARWALGAGLIAAALLQFVGAVCVRRYARELWMREAGEEGRMVCGQRWLPSVEYVDEVDDVDDVVRGEKS